MMYESFNADSYLERYHSRLDRENRRLLDFLNRVYTSLETQEKILDIGSGPTIYQFISASQKTDRIDCCDFSKSARKELMRWLKDDKRAFDWKDYFEYVLKLEEREITSETLKSIRDRVRSSLNSVSYCNVFSGDSLQLEEAKYPVVSSFFCPESVSTTKEDFERSMRNICNKIQEKGWLVISLLENAEQWKTTEATFESFSVDKNQVCGVIEDMGGEIDRLEMVESVPGREYEGIIMLVAQF